jgi:plasmid stabilization system protein ParE
MAYRIRYRNLAKRDVQGIISWLSQFYPGTPGRFLAALKKGITNLEDNPYLYEAWPDNPVYRKMGVMDYLVFYHVDDEKKTVEIIRVLHGARNIKNYLE